MTLLSSIAHSETNADPKSDQNSIPIQISADHVTQSGEKDTIRAWGNVVIVYQEKTLKANKVSINTETGKGEAAGNVSIVSSDGTKFKSKRTRFNMKSETAVISQAKGSIADTYFVHAAQVKRLSEDHYVLNDGAFTTCRGKIPDWSIETKLMDIKRHDRIWIEGAKLKIRDVPILYLPAGYIPMDQTRKSGMLIPSVGSSNTDGFTLSNSYFWAINPWSDATVSIDYLDKRGVRPGLEYRYTPTKDINGKFTGLYLDDKSGTQFWKVDMLHNQNFNNGFNLAGKLDLESDNSFNKTFQDDTSQRTRRQTDSYASLTKTWTDNSLDALMRYRHSSQLDRDDTLGQLPQITFKTQRIRLGETGVFFNQESNISSFLVDLNTSPLIDTNFNVQRVDFHPQLSVALNPTSWLTFTPTLGLRETWYSKGLDSSNKELSGFSRESIDFRAILQGPKFNKIFRASEGKYGAFKHVIEPRFTFDYVPNIDQKDRDKIREFDQIDQINPTSVLSYSLTQRLLKKETTEDGIEQSRQILRFIVSQSYDFREAEKAPSSPNSKRPFSNFRIDLDSRLAEPLIINFDSEYDVHRNRLSSFNFEFGIKPSSSLMMLLERRYTRDENTFWGTSIDWAFKEGWRAKYSARYDEQSSTFRENDFSLLYDAKCSCWGFTLDFVQRTLGTGPTLRDETKFLLGIQLKGLGSISSGKINRRTLREFDDY
ncbi:MAG: hypothetical protein COV66_13400 [Nitrospinae bacterium CG11_big_fil_rev_8_21_14_0_20_45_15]|nr:MAG: hypothetical protein COV66_13400 [Nitrospinae bacterium CG11_big_fil_rev_8_21_14_0_20_45_15]